MKDSISKNQGQEIVGNLDSSSGSGNVDTQKLASSTPKKEELSGVANTEETPSSVDFYKIVKKLESSSGKTKGHKIAKVNPVVYQKTPPTNQMKILARVKKYQFHLLVRHFCNLYSF